MHRRSLLRLAAAATATAAASPWRLAAADTARGGPGPWGELLPPNDDGIQLPRGFRSRVVARAGMPVGNTKYVWPVYPDGGATFRTPDGWIYVANSEWVAPNGGGASAIRFDRAGNVMSAYSICSGTMLNCAGGATPWETWLTCEEYAYGHVWECDPLGSRPAVKRPALGTFQHEAAAVDPARKLVYLTEDVPDGRFYRFTPKKWPNLEAGALEVMQVRDDGSVAWHPVRWPNPGILHEATRHQVAESTEFRGGEGVAICRGSVFFSTKKDDRIWQYDPEAGRCTVLYDAAKDPARQLSGVDNVLGAAWGDVIVAEDGGNMELVLVTPDGVASALLRVVGQDDSEIAGPAFDPSGTRLYLSSQRGDGAGITYEVSGPFRRGGPGARA